MSDDNSQVGGMEYRVGYKPNGEIRVELVTDGSGTWWFECTPEQLEQMARDFLEAAVIARQRRRPT